MAATSNPSPWSDDAPPSYEDYKKEMERLIQKAVEDPVFKDNVKDSFNKASGSEENLKKIAEGVNQFTENITKIDGIFDDIRNKLYAIDMKELKDRKGAIRKWESDWVTLRSKWRSLLSDSQSTALKSVARCEEFKLYCDVVEQITSLEDPRYQDTIIELEHFIKAKGPDGREYNPKDIEDEAKKHSEAFSDLKDKLSNFKTEFDDFSEFQNAELNKDIAYLNGQIKKVEAEIAFDSDMITMLGVALGVTVFTTLAGGVILAALGPLSPLAIGILVVGALIALSEAGAFTYFVVDWFDKTAQKNALKKQVQDREATITALEAVKSKLENQKDGLGFIIVQVDLLKNVWLTISNEANLIVDMLKKAKDMETLTYYKNQIKNANKAYDGLGTSLAKYAGAGYSKELVD